MFKWMTATAAANSATESFNPNDYTFEGDGHLLAIQEAFAELAEIDEAAALINAQGVDTCAEAWQNGGQTAAMETANAFAVGPVMEGFLGDAKNKLVSILKKLKEKLMAFFHSARQYFDAFFKSAQAFAEKYEDEIGDKDLSDFKYEMFTYTLDKVPIEKSWSEVQKYAYDAGVKVVGKDNIAKENCFNIPFDSNIGWVAALETLMSVVPVAEGVCFNHKEKQYCLTDEELPAPWIGPYDGAEVNDDKYKDYTKVSVADARGDKTPVISGTQRKQITEMIMASIAGSSARSTEAFKKELYKRLRGNSTNKKKIKPPVSDIIKTLKNSNDELDKLKDIETNLKDDFDTVIDKVEAAEKKGNEKTRAKNLVTVFTEGKSVFMTMYEVYKNALVERNSAYKSCLSAALHHSPKKND